MTLGVDEHADVFGRDTLLGDEFVGEGLRDVLDKERVGWAVTVGVLLCSIWPEFFVSLMISAILSATESAWSSQEFSLNTCISTATPWSARIFLSCSFSTPT